MLSYIADKHNSQIWERVVTCIFIVIVGCRGTNVGLDTPAYITTWENILYGNPVFIEPGFIYLSKCVQFISTNSSFLFIICAIITYSLIINRLWSYRSIASFPTMIAALFMMYLMSSMNTMRQYVAIAIIFFSIKYIIENKPIKFVLGILLATMFHTSSLLAVVYLGVDFFRWSTISRTRKIIWGCIIISMPLIIKLLLSLAKNEYSGYFSSSSNSEAGLLTIATLLFVVISFIISKLWLKGNIHNTNCIEFNENILIKISFWAYILGILLQSIGYFFEYMWRIGLPFSFLGIVYWGLLMKNTRSNFTKFIYSVIFLLLIGYPFFISIINNGHGTVPYQFIWS